MFQNKKLKRNATYAIAEVAEVALCASNCALPTSDDANARVKRNAVTTIKQLMSSKLAMKMQMEDEAARAACCSCRTRVTLEITRKSLLCTILSYLRSSKVKRAFMPISYYKILSYTFRS